MDESAIDSLIAGCPIFAQLDDAERRALASSSARVTYRSQEPIFGGGDGATQFFVIIDGEVLIQRREDEARTRAIAQFISGESFGEMDVLRSARRTVEAISTKDSTLLVIPGAPRTFSSLVEEEPVVFAGVLRKLIGYVANRIRANNDLLGKNNAWIEEIRRQVYTDKLTGLYNQTYLKDALLDFPPSTGIESSDKEPSGGSSVLAFKPDRFKDINDTFGHEVGDRAIQLLSHLFRETIAPIGSPIRYRGNEFIALLPHHGTAQAHAIAQQLIARVSAIDLTDVTGGVELQLTVSIGIAGDHHGTEKPPLSGDTIVQHAYETMMNARNDGGGRIYLHNAEEAL